MGLYGVIATERAGDFETAVRYLVRAGSTVEAEDKARRVLLTWRGDAQEVSEGTGWIAYDGWQTAAWVETVQPLPEPPRAWLAYVFVFEPEVATMPESGRDFTITRDAAGAATGFTYDDEGKLGR